MYIASVYHRVDGTIVCNVSNDQRNNAGAQFRSSYAPECVDSLLERI